MALRGAWHVECACYPIVGATVVWVVDLRRIDVAAGRLVSRSRVVVPAVPELAGNVHELRRPLVPVEMIGTILQPEVACGVGTCGGDDVPAGPSAAGVVEGGESPGQVVWLV